MVTRHIHLLLLLSGLGTASMLLFFFLPALAGPLLQLPLASEVATFLLRAWAVEVGCMGALLVYAAYDPALRVAVMAAAGASKVGMVVLLVSQLGHRALAGLTPILAFDGLCVVIFSIYLLHRWISAQEPSAAPSQVA